VAYVVLYRSGIFFEPMFIIPFIFFSKCLYSYLKEQKCNNGKNFSNLIGLFVFGALVIFCLIISILYTIIPIYAYHTGNYAIVEGKVENFVSMPPGGHEEESFSIKGIKFSYSDYGITMGYRKTEYFGGVIKGNGQNLKIFYLPSTGNNYEDNTIIYIEEY
jgi:hypothetical protein